ncbi:hypothetical protein ABVT39_013687 [Epinephelus coioides]
MASSSPRSPAWEDRLLIGVAGVSDPPSGGGSSQNPDADRVDELPRLIRPCNLHLYLFSDEDEAPEVEEGEYDLQLWSDDESDDEDVSGFLFEDGEAYPLSSDEEEEDDDGALDDWLPDPVQGG